MEKLVKACKNGNYVPFGNKNDCLRKPSLCVNLHGFVMKKCRSCNAAPDARVDLQPHFGFHARGALHNRNYLNLGRCINLSCLLECVPRFFFRENVDTNARKKKREQINKRLTAIITLRPFLIISQSFLFPGVFRSTS